MIHPQIHNEMYCGIPLIEVNQVVGVVAEVVVEDSARELVRGIVVMVIEDLNSAEKVAGKRTQVMVEDVAWNRA